MKYFSFGMNTNVEQMQQRCPAAECLGSATLYNYQLVFRRHCDIEAVLGAHCDGVLWEISNDNLAALDLLEGYPDYYNRHTVEVYHYGMPLKAMVYQMSSPYPLQLPSSGYLEMVRQGYAANELDLSQLARALGYTRSHLLDASALNQNAHVNQ